MFVPAGDFNSVGPRQDEVSLSLRYQIAQKVHASTDPHVPPAFVNDRARDVVDLPLLRTLTETTGHSSSTEIRAAVEDIFAVRAAEAEATDAPSRTWPTRLTVHQHWGPSFAKAADSAGLTISLAAPSHRSTPGWISSNARKPHRHSIGGLAAKRQVRHASATERLTTKPPLCQ